MESTGKGRFARNSVGMREFVSFVLRNSSEKAKLRQDTLREEYCRQLGITDLTDSEKAFFHDAVRDSFNTLYSNGDQKTEPTYQIIPHPDSDDDESNPPENTAYFESDREVELSPDEPSSDDKNDSDEDFTPTKKKRKLPQKKGLKGKRAKEKNSSQMKRPSLSKKPISADSPIKFQSATRSPLKHVFKMRHENESPFLKKTKTKANLDKSTNRSLDESDQRKSSPSKGFESETPSMRMTKTKAILDNSVNRFSDESDQDKSSPSKVSPIERRSSSSCSRCESSCSESDNESSSRSSSPKANRSPHHSNTSSSHSIDQSSDEDKVKKDHKHKSPLFQLSETILKGSEKLQSYKRFLQKAGLATVQVFNQLAWLKTEEEKIEKIMKILRKNGLTGEPTPKKCEIIRQKVELEKVQEQADHANTISSQGGSTHSSKISLLPAPSAPPDDDSWDTYSSLQDCDPSSDN